MTLAQQRLSDILDWIVGSSAARISPLGDAIPVGPYAVLVPTELDAAPGQDFDAEALPVYVMPEQVAGLSLPVLNTSAPAGQDRMASRFAHIVWLAEQGRFVAAVIGLESATDTLQDALDDIGADIDTTAFPVLFLPLWALQPGDRAAVAAKLAVLP